MIQGINGPSSEPVQSQGERSTGTTEGYISQQKDSSTAATAPQFGEVYRQIQAKYGQKPEKQREIKKTLGKDDFLRIMITQMKNQDPTNPFKAEQMAAEIAQFTNVEQLQNVNQNLTKLSNQNRPVEQMAMTQLIGKRVTIDRERFPHIEGENEDLRFQLPRNGTSVSVSIMSDAGEVVYEKDLGPQNAGEVGFTWDGAKTNSLPAKSGNYLYRVTAKDEKNHSIDINPEMQANIIGVSFEGAEPVFLVGDANRQEKVTLKNIVKIEQDLGASQAALKPKAAPTVPNFPPNLSPSFQAPTLAAVPSSTEATAQPIHKEASAVQMAPQGEKRTMPKNFVPYQREVMAQAEEKGFPNGLTEMKGGDRQ